MERACDSTSYRNCWVGMASAVSRHRVTYCSWWKRPNWMQEQDGAALCTQKILNLVPVVCAAKDAEMESPNDVCCQTYKSTSACGTGNGEILRRRLPVFGNRVGSNSYLELVQGLILEVVSGVAKRFSDRRFSGTARLFLEHTKRVTAMITAVISSTRFFVAVTRQWDCRATLQLQSEQSLWHQGHGQGKDECLMWKKRVKYARMTRTLMYGFSFGIAKLAIYWNVFDPHHKRISIQRGIYLNRERGHRIDPIHIDDPLFPANIMGRNCFRVHHCAKSFWSCGNAVIMLFYLKTAEENRNYIRMEGQVLRAFGSLHELVEQEMENCYGGGYLT
ncbi:hypothetical protein TRIUR3_13289 [Triticum urartu]|uniref:Uncharacterized protein n=1 Tax=Triticum urartu TaxID=4572 RepID=M7YNY3_TRIUA|nr:hypothetical protein TRIUR3_13289 [Triticum urartu]